MISFSQSPGECGAFCECFAQVVWSLYRVFGGLRYRPATLGSLWHVSRTGQAALARGSMVEKQLKQDFPGWKLKRNDIFGAIQRSVPNFSLFSVAAGQKSWVSLVEVQFFWEYLALHGHKLSGVASMGNATGKLQEAWGQNLLLEEEKKGPAAFLKDASQGDKLEPYTMIWPKDLHLSCHEFPIISAWSFLSLKPHLFFPSECHDSLSLRMVPWEETPAELLRSNLWKRQEAVGLQPATRCPTLGGANILTDVFGKQTNRTNLEDSLDQPGRLHWTNPEESRGFFRWLGLFKEQSHSTARAPAVRSVSLRVWCFFGVREFFSGRSIGFFRGDVFKKMLPFKEWSEW